MKLTKLPTVVVPAAARWAVRGHDDPDQHRNHDLQDGARIGARHPRFEGVEAHRIGGADETPAFVLPTPEYAYRLLRLKGLAQPMVDIPHRLLDHSAQAAKPATEVADGDGEYRDREEHQERKLPVEPRHPGQQSHHGQQVGYQGDQRSVCGLGNLPDVERQLRHEPRDGRAIGTSDRERHQFFEHQGAKVDEHTLRDGRERDRAGPVRDRPDRECEHKQDREAGNALGVPVDEAPVQHRLENHGDGGLRGGRDHHREDRERERPPVRTDVAEQPKVEGDGVAAAHGACRAACRGASGRSAGTRRRSRGTSLPPSPRPEGRPWDGSSRPPCPAWGSSAAGRLG